MRRRVVARGLRSSALSLALVAGLAGCRDMVDAVFGAENPDDGSDAFTLQVVPRDLGTQSSNPEPIVVEPSAPSGPLTMLAVRVNGGTFEDGTSVRCGCVPPGEVSHFPMSVRFGTGASVYAALFSVDVTAAASSDAGDAAPFAPVTCDAPLVPAPAAVDAGDGGDPGPAYVNGICPLPASSLKKLAWLDLGVRPAEDAAASSADASDATVSDAGGDGAKADASNDGGVE